MSTVTVLPSETLGEIIDELDEELLSTERALNNAVRKMGDRVTELGQKHMKLRKRRESLSAGLNVMSRHEDLVQLELPGVTAADCKHTRFLPDDEGVVRCVVCRSSALGVAAAPKREAPRRVTPAEPTPSPAQELPSADDAPTSRRRRRHRQADETPVLTGTDAPY